MKAGDLVYGSANGLNGVIIEKGGGILAASQGGRNVAFVDYVILYEDGEVGKAFENELEVVSE